MPLVAQPQARAPESTASCGLNFKVDPPSLTLRRDEEALPPICMLKGEGGPPTPFVSSIAVLAWSDLPKLQVDGIPLREVGFFRLANGHASYHGRATYTDDRNGFSQRTIGKPKQASESLPDGSHRLTVRSELRTKWLKPLESGALAETDDTIVCIDSAVSNRDRLAIFNWCAPKGDPMLPRIANLAGSLTLVPP